MPSFIQTRLEQNRQARKIHGGWVNMLTALTGVKISRIPLPRFLRSKIFNTMYGEKYDPITPEELEQPLEDYRSINHLFTRGIPVDQRPIADAGNGLVSPCDSTVQELGMLQDLSLIHI